MIIVISRVIFNQINNTARPFLVRPEPPAPAVRRIQTAVVVQN